MKKIVGLFCFVFLGLSASAQVTASEQSLIKSVFSLEKKEVVRQNMMLAETDAAVFWQIYDLYEQEKNKQGDQMFKMLNDYAAKFETLTDEDAKKLGQDMLNLRKNNEKIKTKYFNEMSKKINPKVAIRFLQLENYIESAVRFSILSELPFVGDVVFE